MATCCVHSDLFPALLIIKFIINLSQDGVRVVCACCVCVLCVHAVCMACMSPITPVCLSVHLCEQEGKENTTVQHHQIVLD